jgi:hypothetical protein
MNFCFRPGSGLTALLVGCSLSFSSCYTYRLATHAQPATDELTTTTIHAHSLFWGLLNKPQVLQTPNCDKLGVNGVSEVTVKTNLGYALLTIATLGIYCPVNITWKCAKPCQQTESL